MDGWYIVGGVMLMYFVFGGRIYAEGDKEKINFGIEIKNPITQTKKLIQAFRKPTKQV